MSDLTWEQKERVLRYLFAKMNGGSSREQRDITSAPVLPAIEQAKHRDRFTEGTKDDTRYYKHVLLYYMYMHNLLDLDKDNVQCWISMNIEIFLMLNCAVLTYNFGVCCMTL